MKLLKGNLPISILRTVWIYVKTGTEYGTNWHNETSRRFLYSTLCLKHPVNKPYTPVLHPHSLIPLTPFLFYCVRFR